MNSKIDPCDIKLEKPLIASPHSFNEKGQPIRFDDLYDVLKAFDLEIGNDNIIHIKSPFYPHKEFFDYEPTAHGAKEILNLFTYDNGDFNRVTYIGEDEDDLFDLMSEQKYIENQIDDIDTQIKTNCLLLDYDSDQESFYKEKFKIIKNVLSDEGKKQFDLQLKKVFSKGIFKELQYLETEIKVGECSSEYSHYFDNVKEFFIPYLSETEKQVIQFIDENTHGSPFMFGEIESLSKDIEFQPTENRDRFLNAWKEQMTESGVAILCKLDCRKEQFEHQFDTLEKVEYSNVFDLINKVGAYNQCKSKDELFDKCDNLLFLSKENDQNSISNQILDHFEVADIENQKVQRSVRNKISDFVKDNFKKKEIHR